MDVRARPIDIITISSHDGKQRFRSSASLESKMVIVIIIQERR